MKTIRRFGVSMLSLAALALGFGPETASANSFGSWGSWGSHGSSGGSWGSWGSWGSHGSSGGSWGSGSWGSYGSSGGSWGSYGSSGGSWGSYGSSGGYYTAANAGVAPATSVAYLNVNVPADARVYLQNQQMTLTGQRRTFVTPALAAGDRRVYTMRVEVDRNGQTISKTTQVTYTAGQRLDVTVSFDEKNPKELVASISLAANR